MACSQNSSARPARLGGTIIAAAPGAGFCRQNLRFKFLPCVGTHTHVYECLTNLLHPVPNLLDKKI